MTCWSKLVPSPSSSDREIHRLNLPHRVVLTDSSPAVYVPMPAIHGLMSVKCCRKMLVLSGFRVGRVFRSLTLIVMILVQSFTIEFLIQLDNIGIGRVPGILIASAIKTDDQLAMLHMLRPLHHAIHGHGTIQTSSSTSPYRLSPGQCPKVD